MYIKIPSFSSQKQTIHPRVQTRTQTGGLYGEGGLFINPLSSEPAMTDIHHPTLNLPDPNLGHNPSSRNFLE